MTAKTLGQVAYEAWAAKYHADAYDEDIPTWEEKGIVCKVSFEAAAYADAAYAYADAAYAAADAAAAEVRKQDAERVAPLPEPVGRAVARLEAMMKNDGSTWDLSPNDQAAIACVLSDRAEREAVVQAAEVALESLSQTTLPARLRGPLEDLEGAIAALRARRGAP